MTYGSEPKQTALVDYLESRVKQCPAPGLATAIVKGDRIAWSKGFGWANRESKVPMSANTLMNIGSISKTVTATAVMQLWESGKFDLDDDVNGFLPYAVRNPRFPEAPITFRQLLTHRSSIKDGPAYGESYACGDPTVSLEEWIREYFKKGGTYYDGEENFHTWKPGTVHPPERPRAYSNVGYGLLGALVELISKTPFSQYCRDRIFSPLGMKDTCWYIKDLDAQRHAVPYSMVPDDINEEERPFESLLPAKGLTPESLKPGSILPHCLYSFYNYPDGLVRTSVNELSRFLAAYIQGGVLGDARILKTDTVDLMLSPDHFERALCWYPNESVSGEHLWGHGGGDPGISTYMGFRRKDKVGVIAFYNGRPGENNKEVIDKLLEEAASL
jgi:CubicO group peptidase (beta-lactamase class C family)